MNSTFEAFMVAGLTLLVFTFGAAMGKAWNMSNNVRQGRCEVLCSPEKFVDALVVKDKFECICDGTKRVKVY